MKVTLDVDWEKFKDSLVGEYSLAEVKEMSDEKLVAILTKMVARQIEKEYTSSRRYISEIEEGLDYINFEVKNCVGHLLGENEKCRCASYPCWRIKDKEKLEKEYKSIKE